MNPTDPTAPASAPAPGSEHRPSPLAHRQPLGRRVRAYRLLWTIAAAVFVADQVSKFWIVARVPFNPLHAHGVGSDREVVAGFFYIIHVGNTGAAWSLFTGRSVLLALLATATLVAIFLWRHSLGLRDRLAQIAFGLLCGGIVGNLLDRLLHGHVIDFIDLHFGSYIYPTFNVADSAICIGVILYLWLSLRGGGEMRDQGTKGPR